MSVVCRGSVNLNRLILVGNFVFFSFISEMKAPSDYPKALFLLQGTDTIMYIVTAVVIYYYGGQNVTSPALGSTSPLISKIAYGIAIPTVSVLFLSLRAGILITLMIW